MHTRARPLCHLRVTVVPHPSHWKVTKRRMRIVYGQSGDGGMRARQKGPETEPAGWVGVQRTPVGALPADASEAEPW